MDILISVILGLVEGATEFLPISSTGHMIVVSQFLSRLDLSRDIVQRSHIKGICK